MESNPNRVSDPPTGSGGGGGGAEPTSQGRNQSIGGGGPSKSLKSKSVAAANAGRANLPPKLPTCPEGQTMTANQTPCERDTKGRGHGKRRKPGFRVPLKKEDGNMEAQIIEYNCEFPNRVVVRLEYLMQSTKVRLNDRHYMDDFYGKLLEEERIALHKSTRLRERAEQNRMKKLIIDGINKDIPPELDHLHKHPVFRVNMMLQRLREYDTHLGHQQVEEGEEITPVEPYEYNGNQFFKHLHDTGELWVPAAQREYDEGKLEGKIYRAKLRLLQKKKEAAAEEKVLRIINNVADLQKQAEEEEEQGVGGEEGDVPPPSKRNERPSWLVDLEREKTNDDDEDAKLNKALKMNTITQPFSAMDMAVDKIKANAQKEVNRLNEKIRRSKELQKAQEMLLELKRHEQEINFLDTFNYDKARIISRYEKRQKHGQVDELFDRQDQKPSKSENIGVKAKPYERIFEGSTEKDEENTRKNTKFSREPLFLKLQNVYGVRKSHPFHHYENYDNELITEYLDDAEDGTEMMECGENIADMYTRQLMVADDHVKSRLQALRQKRFQQQQLQQQEE